MSMDVNSLINWYANEQHKENFDKIAVKFPLALTNGQYRAACYIAAHPEIFKCFKLDKQINGPFDWVFARLEPDAGLDSSTGTTAPLTGNTWALVHLALNLWNGREFDLESGLTLWDRDLYTVALRAMDLRRSKPFVKL